MTMNNDYRYRLDSPRVTGRRQQKTTCPQCHRHHCFVRYVDTQHGCQYVDDSCGRCDHEQSCGYHYTPSQLMHDQPWRSHEIRGSSCEVRGASYENSSRATGNLVPRTSDLVPRISYLEPAYVSRSHSAQSTFWQWFSHTATTRLGLTAADVQRVFDDYLTGATRTGDVIFWQVDSHGRVRSGHIMHYRADGHRDGYQGWAHTRLIRQGLLPQDFQLSQCLFGEHLLSRRPEATVCIVESEKTALLMAATQPQHLWLATCGSGGLSAAKLLPLCGRRVVLFPDSGCLSKWQQRMTEALSTTPALRSISYTLSDALEQYPPNTDLADLMLSHVPP